MRNQPFSNIGRFPTIGNRPCFFFQRLETRSGGQVRRAAAALLVSLGLTLTAVGDEAAQLMREVRAALPDFPVEISGELQARDRRGTIVRVLNLDMQLDWGGIPATAEYLVRDRFGDPLERLSLQWPVMGGLPAASWAAGEGELQPFPDLNTSIAGLDLHWADVTLTFLWWNNGRIRGQERIRGRYCTIIELPAPEGQVREGGQVPRYAKVRLWIDPETKLLMQADALDQRGRVLRRIQVKSLQKIDDLWMIQNLDMFNYQTRERITLRVRSLDY
jgi:hypothetical protein